MHYLLFPVFEFYKNKLILHVFLSNFLILIIAFLIFNHFETSNSVGFFVCLFLLVSSNTFMPQHICLSYFEGHMGAFHIYVITDNNATFH